MVWNWTARTMTSLRRNLAAGVAVIGTTVTGCHDGLLHAPAAPTKASLSISPSIALSRGGPSQAFDRADGVFIRIRAAEEVRAEFSLPFQASGPQTVVRLDVPLRQLTETFGMDLELRSTGRALFRGSGSASLSSGLATSAEITLTPVVAGVICAGGVVQLASYGQVERIQAAALFATGDTIPNIPISWSIANASIATVSSAGDVTAVADGNTQATCATGGFTANRAVTVFAAVAAVAVAPPTATIPIGGTVPLTTTLRDARDNVITTPRPLVWSTPDGTIASVNGSGVVTGIARGTARIIASSGAVAGSALVTVSQGPTATTDPATNIGIVGATLNGRVNPNGSATQAWFQYGTSPTLATFAETAPQSVGSGTGPVVMAQAVSGLQPATTYYYRAIASNAGGTSQGAILTFTLINVPPPSVNTDAPTGVGVGSATFNARLNANGFATDAWFQYGTSPTLATFTETAPQSVGSGTSPLAIAQVQGSLQPATTYYYRIVASNIGGSSQGTIVSFRTLGSLPTVGNGSGIIACAVPNATQCTLLGFVGADVNPGGLPTTVWFEYSTTSTFTTFSSTAPKDAGSGFTTVRISDTVPGVVGSVIPFVRAVAQNPLGIVRSAVFQAHFP